MFLAERFVDRHLGPNEHDRATMLAALGFSSLDEMTRAAVPSAILTDGPPALPPALSEREALAALTARAAENELWRSYIGLGYFGTVTPPVVLRNVLENPSWYTAYTPYQAEISQGRLEALLVFQTLVQELTGLEIANASLLDEATAAAEAMAMSHRVSKLQIDRYVVDRGVLPQTLSVLQTRAEPLGIEIVVADLTEWDPGTTPAFGVLLQNPAADGRVRDLTTTSARAHAAGAIVTCATDLLACVWMQPPGAQGVDIAVGSAQRFGVPMGYGGPHAGFMATRFAYQRQMPGRLIGVSVDADGNPALRMALQTREQHIRREKATSNVCTAQVLLSIMAAMYGVWHGPTGLSAIAQRIHSGAQALADAARKAGFLTSDVFFDTVRIDVGTQEPAILARAARHKINLRQEGRGVLCVAFDETMTEGDLHDLFDIFGVAPVAVGDGAAPASVARSGTLLQQPVFHSHHSETAMLRYLHHLARKDYALDSGMIPLGSCTMKLNATTEMIPVTFPGFGNLHPFVPREQAKGYTRLFGELETWLAAITGFDVVALQPNAGSQGEYAGLLAIRGYHRSRGDAFRDICLIPVSAHGTNPASAVMAGLQVVVVACDAQGNVDLADLGAKVDSHRDRLAALMVTYPSTHGVYEEGIVEALRIVHAAGGQVYMDGANLNAQVGLVLPAQVGADVLHINLHKTFCIPHGGGGPGMGPICARAHLGPFLPGHPVVGIRGDQSDHNGAVSAAPWGSSSILPISWAYIAMCGPDGVRLATQVALLAANYVAKRLEGHYEVLYRGNNGLVAHECILDLRPFKSTGVSAEDVAKRLMDYGFHAPTLSFPVVGTLMVEPTESEPLAELDRFVEAMIAIRDEIRAIERGEIAYANCALKHAPHTAMAVTATTWDRAYSRQDAAFPTAATRAGKYWPTVARVDNAAGDRTLICSCDGWPTG